MPRIVAMLVCLAVIPPECLQAQGGFLERVNAAAKRAAVEVEKARAAAAAVAVARIVKPGTIIGSDSVATRVAGDSGTTRTKPAGSCGVTRTCSPGWDLAVKSFAPVARPLPIGSPVQVTVEVENRGRAVSQASDLVVSVRDREIATLALPPLASGEVLRHAFRTTFTEQDQYLNETAEVRAVIDPSGVTEEGRRDNNQKEIKLVAERRSLTFDRFDVPTSIQGTRFTTVDVLLRNNGFATTTPATSLRFWSDCGYEYGGYSIPVPALAPRQEYAVSVSVQVWRRAEMPGSDANCRLEGLIDGERQFEWKRGNPAAARNVRVLR